MTFEPWVVGLSSHRCAGACTCALIPTTTRSSTHLCRDQHLLNSPRSHNNTAHPQPWNCTHWYISFTASSRSPFSGQVMCFSLASFLDGLELYSVQLRKLKPQYLTSPLESTNTSGMEFSVSCLQAQIWSASFILHFWILWCKMAQFVKFADGIVMI